MFAFLWSLSYNRNMFSDPSSVVAQLHIDPSSKVADLGAGTGAYSFAVSSILGPEGRVYACDVQKDILVRLDNEVRERGVHNIQTVHSNVESHLGTKLRDASIDWAIVANVLYQIEDREGFLKEIVRILKPGGSMLLVDWSESFGNLGPHEKDVIKESDAIQKCESIGLKKSPQVINAGSHHYGVVFKK